MKTLAEVEKDYILAVYDECGGNRTKAAQVLDIGIRSLQRRLAEYGLPPGSSGNPNGKPVRCVETGQEYRSYTEAAIHTGIWEREVAMSIQFGQAIKGLTFEAIDRMSDHKTRGPKKKVFAQKPRENDISDITKTS